MNNEISKYFFNELNNYNDDEGEDWRLAEERVNQVILERDILDDLDVFEGIEFTNKTSDKISIDEL
ncbi:hypothetical protein KCM76_16180 [Zooshikella marina]|uniref:hypothetical protein n=1 Tax=Zooshikella ganghwensis TaxID=202772 RepID=UPI001BAF17A3|nr:hypothetical protein [Zooshikella ganghwensis]MBU2707533.1 hypothetical protein [Zooshikella ganghwensis]